MMGMDTAHILEEGFIYEMVEHLDKIVIRKLGKTALPKNIDEATEMGLCDVAFHCSSPNLIMMHGRYLLTKEGWMERVETQEGE